ncbi:MAG: hypothetical protein M9938_02920 [Solirubrobacterales bacterium]|nr:hypothetical protein [Solirubrobacterales bacterium]
MNPDISGAGHRPPAGGGSPLRIPDGPLHQPYPRAELHPTDLLGSFFVCGLVFLAAAAFCGLIQAISPWDEGRWLALHLAFFGGVSQLILGAGQFFAGAFLAIDPPSRRMVRSQLLLWNGGSILLGLAVPLGSRILICIAVALLASALTAWIRSLVLMKKRSLNRTPWATRWYLAAAAFFLAGILAGGLLAGGIAWPYGHLAGAHMVLNLGGWFGAAIIGTLHTFYPTLTRTRLRFERLQPAAFGLWSGGVALLAGGYLIAADFLVIAGWILLIGSAGLLLVNVIACRIASRTILSLPARVVGTAQPFLPAGLIVLAVATIVDGSAWSLAGSSRAAAGTLLVAGWVGLTVLGSLIHLLVILVRARDHRRPVPVVRPIRDSLLAGVAAFGVAGVAVSQIVGAEDLGRAFQVLLLIGYSVLAARVAWLGIRVLRHARPVV